MKNLDRWILVGLVLSGSACADLPSATSPEPAPAFNTAVDGGEEGEETQYPAFASFEEAAAAMGDAAILWATPTVEFSGNTARATAAMGYYGNWAEITVSLVARNSKGEAKAQGIPTHESSFWQKQGNLSTVGYTEAALIGPACGGVATNTSSFHVKHLFVLKDTKYIPTVLSERSYPRSKTETQAACPPEPCPAAYTGGDGAQWSSYWVGNAWDCEQEKDEPASPDSGSGGSGPCPECLDRPTVSYCNVTHHYWKDTGEIFRTDVNWCA